LVQQENETKDNTFKKLYRIIRRDLLKKDPQDVEGFGARHTFPVISTITSFGSLVALALGGPAAAAIALFTGGSFMALSAARDLHSEHKKTVTKAAVSGSLMEGGAARQSGKQTIIVGPTSAVNTLRNTQMLIDEWTDRHRIEDIPAKVAKRLLPYIADAYNAAAQVDAHTQTVRNGAIISSEKIDSIRLLCSQFDHVSGGMKRTTFKKLPVKSPLASARAGM
jgi:hypothetical protein